MSAIVRLFRNAAARYSRDGCAFLAQAIAFNAIFALFPLVLLTMAVLGFLYGSEEGKAKALDLIGTLAPDVQPVVAANLGNVVALRGLSGAIGLVGLVWSGKNLFLALSYGLNRALGVQKSRPFILEIALAIVMLPATGMMLLVATVAPVAVSYLIHKSRLPEPAHLNLPEIAGYAAALVLVFFLSGLFYTVLPNVRVGRGFAIPGALFTALSWAALQVAFAVYTTHTNFLAAYGAVSGILALLFWFDLMATVFLFGAELCAERAAARPA
jgi:membrane protein